MSVLNSNPIEGMEEVIRKKIHKCFHERWSVFHVPIHSVTFPMDKQFCWREMDEGIKENIRSVMEDFSKSPGVKDFSKMKV
jgi:hypothetical protein